MGDKGGMEVDMDNETKCECHIDVEGYHKCASCEAGKTDAGDFLSQFDYPDWDADVEPEY